MHTRINRALHPSDWFKGLQSVDVPASVTQTPYPEGPDPKTWSGSWRTITDPEEMVAHVCAANVRQYHQAHSSPFCSEPLLSFLGYCADTQGSTNLAQGIVPPAHILDHLLLETKQVCQTLANFHPSRSTWRQKGISTNAFTPLYKTLDERTSSSPSGWHTGHYKAAITSDTLSSIHSQLMSIPAFTGHSPSRWHQTVDIMLEKKAGDCRIHRLQIIALQESDFNQVNCLVLGRPIQHKLEDSGIIHDIQHGSRESKQCHSAILNKVLTFEIHMYMKKPMAYIKNDAVGCFDHIANPLV